MNSDLANDHNFIKIIEPLNFKKRQNKLKVSSGNNLNFSKYNTSKSPFNSNLLLGEQSQRQQSYKN